MEGVVGESIDGWWLPVNRLYINDTLVIRDWYHWLVYNMA
jgi:hypothetical protein